MAKMDQIVGTLQKLYGKRNVLDKQIANAEKKLIAEAKVAAKPAAPAKKPAAKGKKSAAAKKAGAKLAPKPVSKPASSPKPLLKK